MSPATSVDQINTQLCDSGIALTDIGTLNPALDRLLALRRRLGVRNSAHTLCKLLDPCPGHTVRVVNVTHPEYLIRMGNLLGFPSPCFLRKTGAPPHFRRTLVGPTAPMSRGTWH